MEIREVQLRAAYDALYDFGLASAQHRWIISS
jgi:hypothetical protein